MRRYPEYKESGVEWIGETPAHWETKAVWMIFRLGRGRVISNVEMGANPGQYPVYSSQTEDDGIMGYIDTYDFEGDYITWTTDGAKAGTVFYRTGKFNCTNVCGMLSPIVQNVNLRFFGHALNIVTSRFVRHDINPKLMNNVMARIRVQVPPLKEQTQIANFLDRKTTQIDELIRGKERRIELLREQRTALINQAVTKGLDPNVEMKPSGVEWIGEIPVYWNAVPMTKYLESTIDYRGRTPEKTESGRFLVTAKNIRDGNIDYQISQEFTSEYEYQRIMTRGMPQKGDVLFTTEAPLGEVANVDDVSIALAQRIIKFRPKSDSLNPYFLKYWILSYSFQSDLRGYATGSTAQGIKASKLCLLKLNLPPLEEQIKIVDYLDQKTQEINELISAEEQKIELLMEYRQSLISEAVTGKIDVRNEV